MAVVVELMCEKGKAQNYTAPDVAEVHMDQNQVRSKDNKWDTLFVCEVWGDSLPWKTIGEVVSKWFRGP